MSLFKVGRVCLKLAGRDAGRKCVVVEQLENSFVMVDGDVRRRKVNLKHLEPLAEMVEIKSKASHEDVKKAFEKLDLPVWERKSKPATERPKQQRKVKEKKPVEKKSKKSAKKEEKPEAKKSSVEELVGGEEAETPAEVEEEAKAETSSEEKKE